MSVIFIEFVGDGCMSSAGDCANKIMGSVKRDEIARTGVVS